MENNKREIRVASEEELDEEMEKHPNAIFIIPTHSIGVTITNVNAVARIDFV